MRLFSRRLRVYVSSQCPVESELKQDLRLHGDMVSMQADRCTQGCRGFRQGRRQQDTLVFLLFQDLLWISVA